MSAADVVARQVDAYNAHDLESFVACYADDIVLSTGDGEVILEGIAAVRDQYDLWFSGLTDLHATIRGRLACGTWVVDEEHATATGLDVEALVAYHVCGDRIDRVVLMTAETDDRPPHR
jgi:hypothetical protein